MACPRLDFHIHTYHLGCANATMTIPAIIAETRRLGLETIAITDHLNTLDRLPLHRKIREDLERYDGEPGPAIYFAVELNYQGPDGEFAYSPEVRDEYGFQFAIGGIHSNYTTSLDPREIVEIQHRHHLKTCMNPLVDILVHPYWLGSRDHLVDGIVRNWQEEPSLRHVPESYIRELGQVARETGTAIEVSGSMVGYGKGYSDAFVEAYREYLSVLAEEGVLFAPASDAHDISNLALAESAWQVIESLGIGPDRVWRPAGPPFLPGTRD